MIFAAPGSLAAGKAFYADIKQRMQKLGRDPAALKIMPAALVVVGDTVEQAREQRARLDSLVHYDSGIGSLNSMLGYDVSGFDPDGPLPEIPETNSSRSARERMVNLARTEHLTIRQLAQKAGQLCGACVCRHAGDDR